MYIINFFGTGIRFWICKIPNDDFAKFEEIKNKRNESYENIFFDLEILNRLGYKSWAEIYPTYSGNGLKIETGNWIEIRKNARKIRTIECTAILKSTDPFEQYKTDFDNSTFNIDTNFKNVALIQLEKGLVFKYKLNQQSMNLDLLKLHLHATPPFLELQNSFITGLSYQEERLESEKSDLMVVGTKVILLF